MMLRTRKRDRISKSSSVHVSQLKVTLLQQKQTKLHLQAPHPEKKSIVLKHFKAILLYAGSVLC